MTGKKFKMSVAGAILIVIGVIFLLQAFNVISGDVWGKLWPVILIVIGVALFFKQDRNGKV